MAKITPILEIHLDVTKPIEEISQVISVVLSSSPPENHKRILEGLDFEIGNALSRIQAEERIQEQK